MGLRAVVVVLVLAGSGGCGRIAFDRPADGGAPGDGRGDVGDATADATIDPTLLLWFTFDANGFLADGATNHDATCSSCPVATAGPTSATSAAQFDGNDCLYVAWPTPRPAQLTYAAWVRADTARSETVFGSPYMSATGVNNAFEIYTVNADTMTVQLNTTIGFEMPAMIGQWHHIAATYDGTDIRGYIDGALFGTTASAALMYTFEPMMIGCDLDAGVELAQFIGAIDEVRLYSRVLSAPEVAALAQ